MRIRYQHRFLTWELAAALILSGAAIAYVEFGWGREHLVEALQGVRQGMYVAIASISGSLLGFILATVTIVQGFLALPRLALVRGSKHYPTLYTIFFSAIRYLAVTTVWGLIAVALDRDVCPKVWVSYVMSTLVLVSIARLYRCIWALENVVRAGIGPGQERGNRGTEEHGI